MLILKKKKVVFITKKWHYRYNKKMRKTVFVAMSGGVDSSVAAALIQKQGYRVVGAHMRCFNVDGCAERDAEDARRVSEQLGIPFYSFNLEKEYQERVVKYMIEGYKQGITPNPDVMCNKEIKFGLFLKRALKLGADYIATGHYVRLKLTNNELHTNKRIRKIPFVHSQKIRYSLMTARDRAKDQSYFLWTLTQAQLKHCLFPIGEYAKPEVRALARKYGLLTAEKKDSQGICFLGQVTLAHFLKNYIPARRGEVVTTAGQKIGEHNGAHFYTIGQRHGFTVQSAKRKAQNIQMQPHYVIKKNVADNTLVVAEGNKNQALYKKEITLTHINFIYPSLYPKLYTLNPLPVFARVRYRELLTPATLIVTTAQVVQVVKLIFNEPQKFIAPGQSAVFYNKRGEMLGGGIIV